MKKTNFKHNKSKSTPRARVIKDLAGQLDQELKTNLPITVLPDGSAIYKDYLVKLTKHNNWGVFNVNNKQLVDQFFLKTCALMAAKAYNNTQLEKFFEIKRLDNRYWANHCDTLVYTHNIKTAKEYNRYLILLNKLEHSTSQEAFYKEEISRMFKWSFV